MVFKTGLIFFMQNIFLGVRYGDTFSWDWPSSINFHNYAQNNVILSERLKLQNNVWKLSCIIYSRVKTTRVTHSLVMYMNHWTSPSLSVRVCLDS